MNRFKSILLGGILAAASITAFSYNANAAEVQYRHDNFNRVAFDRREAREQRFHELRERQAREQRFRELRERQARERRFRELRERQARERRFRELRERRAYDR
ncbi:hypothetical protein [Nostoc sp. MS1]|uniref:hypothetical protein n=1 Tax=Nostoc sp. MS1 TaxID=2764711 RepID=UPI001CC7C069|nr:hypothetical protein [Nostoc sp. MS1]BCL37669.1 hypothetical protein NSMS1_41160 [Nostoc sp. MS1]